MDNQQAIKQWHLNIIADIEKQLQRPLTTQERQFIESRQGYLATEAIADFIRGESAETIEQYLNQL